MNTTKSKRHSATPRTDDGTRATYADASKTARAASKALEDALRDPALVPAALHAPPVLDRATGEVRSRPWAARGVTAPRARRVLDYATRQYLAGYSKVEAGSRWTRSSGEAPYLPLIRQTTKALGMDERSGSNRSAIGAVYGYLDALGVLAYEPGKSDRYSYLAYGTAALAHTYAVARPSEFTGVSHSTMGEGSTTALWESSRESLREKKSLAEPKIAQREPVAQSVTVENREGSTNRKDKSKSNTSGASLTQAGATYLDALSTQLGRYGPRYARTLREQGYRGHGALISQANRHGLLAEAYSTDGYGYGVAVRALDLGNRDNLDRATDLPSTLAAIMRERYGEVEARLGRVATEVYSGEAYHYGDGPDAIRAEEPGTLADALAGLNLPEGESIGADPRTAVAVGTLTAGSEIAEWRPAYETGEPLRSRLILDAVRHGATLGYGIPEEEAVALHAHYLDLRQAGTLDAERDLYEIQAALGRPLALQEVALYGVAVRVGREEWAEAEAATLRGDPLPAPIQAGEVTLSGATVEA